MSCTATHRVIFAFPGMGKTPLAKRTDNMVDLDFGHYRDAHGVKKENESSLYESYIKLLFKYYEEGWNVLTNNPHIICKVAARLGGKGPASNAIRMFLPSEKGLKYCAEKMGVDEVTVSDWVKGWENDAHACGLTPIYIDVGLDHYLSTLPKKWGKNHETSK